MEGIITLKYSRKNLDKMKFWRKCEASKVVDYQKREENIDKFVNITKGVVSFAGTAATVALSVCPLDGPFGEIATVAATPALVQAVESSRGLLKGMFVNKDSNQIQAAMTDLQSNVKNITIPDRNIAKTVSVNDLDLANNTMVR